MTTCMDMPRCRAARASDTQFHGRSSAHVGSPRALKERSAPLSLAPARLWCVCVRLCVQVYVQDTTQCTQTRFYAASIYGNPQNTHSVTEDTGLRAARGISLSLSMPHIPSDRALVVAPPTPSPHCSE